MSVIPCQQNTDLKRRIREFAETLRTEAHTLGTHGLSETDFYQGGLFRGAIERIRGQFSATMREKRDFVRRILNHMQDRGFIKDWSAATDASRHDYSVTLSDDRVAAIELKGCLDGNNTNIFERPPNVQEFVIWSVCTNASADPRHNVWSGIHTRLSAEIIENKKLVDGVIVWDWLCGTIGRPCPKLESTPERKTVIGPFQLVPPCVYLFPGRIPRVGIDPSPEPHTLDDVRLLRAFHDCFGGLDEEVNSVRFIVSQNGSEVLRVTEILRANETQHTSGQTPIRRR